MSESRNNSGHERWQNDAAAYALRALEESELGSFEQHLAGCAQCQHDLAAMQVAVDALASAVAAGTPAAELRDRVMGVVRAEAGTEPAAESAKRRDRRRQRPFISWRRWAAPALATAALVALVVALSVGGGGSTRIYAGVVYAPGASASVRVSGGHARLVFARLPALPGRLIYEMWLERGAGAPVPAGALFLTATGAVAVPGGVRGVDAVLVTAERRPYGSSVPTRKPLVVVRLT